MLDQIVQINKDREKKPEAETSPKKKNDDQPQQTVAAVDTKQKSTKFRRNRRGRGYKKADEEDSKSGPPAKASDEKQPSLPRAGTGPKNPCQLCQQQHYTNKCTAYKDYNQRVSRARELELCLKCLKQCTKIRTVAIQQSAGPAREIILVHSAKTRSK
uniref:Gag-like protein n=1 Tax=Ditylenchus dipsaci TaxID=166011 RepID=A0A915D5A1_9BILA